MSQPSPLEPTILGAILRRWRLVAVFVMLAIALALAYLALNETKYRATATVVLRDPRGSAETEAAFTGYDQEAYTNQQKNLVDNRSVDIGTLRSLITQFPERTFSLTAIEKNLVVDAPINEGRLDINFTDGDPAVAVAGAEAALAKFREIRPTDALQNLNVERDALNVDLANVEEDLQGHLENMAAAQTRYNAIIGESAQARQEQTEVLAEIAFHQEQALEARREASLIRDDLRDNRRLLDANDSGDRGIQHIVNPSTDEVERVGSGAVTLLTLAAVLGSLLGTAVAYLLSVRRREFADKAQPEVALDAPLIAEIVNPSHERIRRLQFPVVDAPHSAVTEGYRFVGSAIATNVTRDDTERRSVGVGAGTDDEDADLIVANIALALAGQGLSVLLVDADIRRGELTRVLCADKAWSVHGLTDVLAGTLSAQDALKTVEINADRHLKLLSAGTQAGVDAPACRPDTLRAMLVGLERSYDVVLVNVPPILRSADAASVLGAIGSLVVLVDHGSSVDDLLDIGERIDVADTDLIGYVYTNAPMSRAALRSIKRAVGSRRSNGSTGSDLVASEPSDERDPAAMARVGAKSG